MATLAEAIRTRDTLHARYRGAPWLRGLGVGLSEFGYDLELRAPGPMGERSDVVQGVPFRLVSGAYVPLGTHDGDGAGVPPSSITSTSTATGSSTSTSLSGA